MDPREREESLMNRIQNYVFNLEHSNSSLELQLSTLKSDLAASNSLYQDLQAQNNNLIEKSEESESRKRILDMFLELRLQEKEIFIKNIELLLLRIQKQQNKELELFKQLDCKKTESIFKDSQIQEYLLEIKQLKHQMHENTNFLGRDQQFFKEEVKAFEQELVKEKEKLFEMQKLDNFRSKELENLKRTISELQEENSTLKRRLIDYEEQNRGLEKIIIEKKRESEALRNAFDDMIIKYEEDLKHLVENLKVLQKSEEERVLALDVCQRDLLNLKKQKAAIEEQLQEKTEEYREEIEKRRYEENLLKTMSFLNESEFSKFDKENLFKTLQKAYVIEKTQSIHLKQTLKHLKKALTKKYETLAQKFEEWEEFQKKFQEIKYRYDIQNKKIKDLLQDQQKNMFEIKELNKRNRILEVEKNELMKAIDSISQDQESKGKYIGEIIEKNTKLQLRLEEIFHEKYLEL